MQERPTLFAYIIPMHEGNSAADDLEFWTERGELFRAYIVRGEEQFTEENFSTFQAAKASLVEQAQYLGYRWEDVEFSVDE